jgi:hypothetical protein
MTESKDALEPKVFSLECQSPQCLFYMGDRGITVLPKDFWWCRLAKMIHHIENVAHAQSLALTRTLEHLKIMLKERIRSSFTLE